MEAINSERLIAVLHAQTAVLSALLATHSQPADVRRALDELADRTPPELDAHAEMSGRYWAAIDTYRALLERP